MHAPPFLFPPLGNRHTHDDDNKLFHGCIAYELHGWRTKFSLPVVPSHKPNLAGLIHLSLSQFRLLCKTKPRATPQGYVPRNGGHPLDTMQKASSESSPRNFLLTRRGPGFCLFKALLRFPRAHHPFVNQPHSRKSRHQVLFHSL